MFKIVLALHVLTAVFAIGPLVHAATTASRGIRQRDAAAIAGSARLLRIYSYASVLVVILGFALMSTTSDYTHKRTAEFSELWIWLSLLLWAVAVALVFAVLVPTLTRASAGVVGPDDGASTTGVSALVGRVAAAGGTVGLIFAAIIFLMIYRPGH
jgi:glucan phosphoethanolaminetransferase (alkaline phosphatase superfamily)